MRFPNYRVRARRAEEREAAAANKEEKPATEGGDAPAAAPAAPLVDSPLPCAEEQNSAMSDDQLDGKVAKMEQVGFIRRYVLTSPIGLLLTWLVVVVRDKLPM